MVIQVLLRKELMHLQSQRIYARYATTSTIKFDLPLIRDEILHNWLLSESKDPASQSRQAQYCNFTYHDSVKAYQSKGGRWHWLDRELSSNLAGETGAVHIYKGALAAMSLRTISSDAYKFSLEHMANEESHLRLFTSVVHPTKRTILLPLWRMAGWTLGFLPTLIGGSKGLYVTVLSVETFVEEHFHQQIQTLKEAGNCPELLKLLEHCIDDEVHHKEDAAKKLLGNDQKEFTAWWVNPWSNVVRCGSTVAANIARHV